MAAKWITAPEFSDLTPVNVFHRERESTRVGNDVERQDSHILFRKKISLREQPKRAILTVTADDRYKLYVNGDFVTEGPVPSYHFRYRYDTVDVTKYLKKGENTFAFHTLYQGLINRVFQSGDRRHGLYCELLCDGKTVMQSDESFLYRYHGGYTPVGKVGYDTQFLEDFDSGAAEADFFEPSFNDAGWDNAAAVKNDDHILTESSSKHLVFERIEPQTAEKRKDTLFIDFGGCFVGYLHVKAKGKKGDTVTVRCGQELNGDGSVRYNLRANCVYEEKWTLSGNTDTLDWFDYKSFRYAELTGGAELYDVYLLSRHYPFELSAEIRNEYRDDEDIKKVFDLCVRSQKYGVQEMVMDCMEREKGVYLGDGCYTSLCNFILTGDDAMMRRFIEDAFATSSVTDTLLSCLDCSMMQEIAEYPLILVELILWHFRLTGDIEFLKKNANRADRLMTAYRKYEKDGLLHDTGKWCVTEWPANYRDGYTVNNDGNKEQPEPHVAINAYYINALKALNEIHKALGYPKFCDTSPILSAFENAFYDGEAHLFCDGVNSRHISYIGNAFAFGFGLSSDDVFYDNMTKWFGERGITGTSLFATFPLLCGLARIKRYDLIKSAIKDKKAWLNMIAEGGTATFECWSKDGKWNTSLFHLQNTHVAAFIADTDLSLFLI